MRVVRSLPLLLASLAAIAAASFPTHASAADEAASEPAPGSKVARIRDNLFLLEEAYNQEPGVIQHISLFQFQPKTRGWAYSFTEEWPVPTDLNQLSVTVNAAGEGSAGFGDMLLNYRIQALGLGGESVLAMAPRVSVVLPSGNPRVGNGRGAIGLQFNVPVSIELDRHFVLHLNAGATVTPSAHSPGGRTETALDTNLGAALVWQPLHWMNALVEVVHLWTEDVGDLRSVSGHALIVNPGLRFAVDHDASGLQVVPGVSVPLQVYPSGQFSAGFLTYLSFEHPAF